MDIDVNFDDVISVKECEFLGVTLSWACAHGVIEDNMWLYIKDVAVAWPKASPYYMGAAVLFREPRGNWVNNYKDWRISGNTFVQCMIHYAIVHSDNADGPVRIYNDSDEHLVFPPTRAAVTTGPHVVFIDPKPDSYGAYFVNNQITNTADFSYWYNHTAPTNMVTVVDVVGATNSQSYGFGGSVRADQFIGKIDGSNVVSGTVAPARLGSGSSITTKFLRGDSTWQTLAAGSGDMLAANNLSDVVNAGTARTNIAAHNASSLTTGTVGTNLLPVLLAANVTGAAATVTTITEAQITNALGATLQKNITGNAATATAAIGVTNLPWNSTPYRVIFVGDSYTAGSGASPGIFNAWTNVYGTHQNLVLVTNSAVAGRNIQTMVANYTNEVQIWTNTPGTNSLIVFFAGINSLKTNSITGTFQELTNYWYLAMRDGFKVVRFTIPDRGDGGSITTNRFGLGTLNERIRNPVTYGVSSTYIPEYLVDSAAVWTDVADTNCIDLIHWNTNGCIAMAKSLQNTLLGNSKFETWSGNTYKTPLVIAGSDSVSSRDSFLKITHGNDTKASFEIANSGFANSGFGPCLVGFNTNVSYRPLTIRSLTMTAGDSGTVPMTAFQGLLASTVTDPKNNLTGSVVNRPVIGVIDYTAANVFTVGPTGNVYANGTITTATTMTATNGITTYGNLVASNLTATATVIANAYTTATNAWALNTTLPWGTNSLVLTSGATTGGIIGISGFPTSTEGSVGLLVKATGDVVFTNAPGFVCSDFLASRTITNGNFARIGITLTPGVCTNLDIVQYR